MKELLFAPAPPSRTASALLLLRVATGSTFIMHGYAKAFGFGFAGVAGWFGSIGIPAPTIMAALVIALELGGGLALAAGFLTRPLGLMFAVQMLVAMMTAHAEFKFLMPDGIELELMMATAAVTLALAGPGALALDSRFGTHARGRPEDR